MNTDVKEKVKKVLSPKRWQHSLGVAKTAEKLADHWGVSPEKAYLAGILHDYAREIPRETFPDLVEKFGGQVSPEERLHPVVLHAVVSAWLAEQKLGISDPEVLQAVSRHTLGGAEMTALDKIVFLADIIEPSRDWAGVEALRQLVYQDLNQAMLAALDYNIAYFEKKQELIHPLTMVTRDFIIGEMERGKKIEF